LTSPDTAWEWPAQRAPRPERGTFRGYPLGVIEGQYTKIEHR
jgi:hypothetical protein